MSSQSVKDGDVLSQSVNDGAPPLPSPVATAYSRLEATIRRFNQEKLALEERITVLGRELSSREHEVHQYNATIKGLKLENELLTNAHKEDSERLETQNKRLSSVEKLMGMLIDATTTYETGLESLESQADMFADSNNNVTNMYHQLEEKFQETIKEKDDAFSELTKSAARLESDLTRKIHVVQVENDRLLQKIDDSKGVIVQLTQKVTNYEQQLEAAEQRVGQAEARCLQVCREKDANFADLVKTSTLMDSEKKRELDHVYDENRRLQKKNEDLAAEIEILKDKVKRIETQVADVAQAKDEVYAGLVELKELSDAEFIRKLEAANAENSKLAQTVTKYEQELEALMVQKNKCDAEYLGNLEAADSEISKLAQTVTNYEQQLEAAEQRVGQAEARCLQVCREKDANFADLVKTSTLMDSEKKRELDHVYDENRRLQKKNEDLAAEIEILKDKVKRIETQVADVAQAKDEVYAGLVELKELSDAEFIRKLEAANAENSKLAQTVTKYEQELEALMVQKNKCDAEYLGNLEAADSEISKLAQTVTNYEQQLEAAEQRVGQAEARCLQVCREKDANFADLVKTSTLMDSEKKRELDHVYDENRRLQKKNEDLAAEIEILKDKVKRIETQVADVAQAKDEVYAGLVELQELSDAEFIRKLEAANAENSKLALTVTKYEQELEALMVQKNKCDAEYLGNLEAADSEISKLAQTVTKYEQELEAAEQRVGQAEARCLQVCREKDANFADLVKTSTQMDSEKKRELDHFYDENRRLQKKNEELAAEIEILKEHVKRIETQVADVAQAKDEVYDGLVELKALADAEYIRKLEAADSEISKLAQTVTKYEQELEAAEQRVGQAEARCLQVCREKDADFADLVKTATQMDSEKKREVDYVYDKNRRLQQKNEDLAAELEILKDKVKRIETQVADVAQAKDEVYAGLVELKELSDAEYIRKLEAAKAENTKLAQTIRKQEASLDAVNKKLKDANANLTKFKSNASSERMRKVLPRQMSLPRNARASRPRQGQFHERTSSDDESSASVVEIDPPISKVVQGISAIRVNNSPLGKRDGQCAVPNNTPFKKIKPDDDPPFATTSTSSTSTTSGIATPTRKFFKNRPILASTPKTANPNSGPAYRR